MPTFTTIAWETLLEPRLRDSQKCGFASEQRVDGEREKTRIGGLNHLYISPALYVTPEQTPIPESSSDVVSPSPYVVNHKRRGGRRSRQAVSRRVDGFEVPQQEEEGFHGDENNSGGSGGGGDGDFLVELEEDVVGDVAVEDRNESSVAGDEFLDPCDSASVASSIELSDFGKKANSFAATSNQGDFFDADEDFSDGALSIMSSSYGLNFESELRATRFSLLEEIERRKAAEDCLDQIYSQWQRIANLLAGAGLTFPMPSSSNNVQLEIDSMEQLSQELLVARFVSEAIGKGQARAEAEIVAEQILESKDLEISRLRDRLQYYETVNRGMSQRNQEVMEVARRQRQWKKKQKRWLWGGLGLSAAIGASVVACLYLTGERQEMPTSESQEQPDFKQQP